MKSTIQRYTRTKVVLPLRVWVGEPADDSAQQLAHTIDISPAGGRLGGLRNELLPGQTITLQRGQQKTPCRVIWNNCLAPGEHQAGIEALALSKDIWGVDLPQTPAGSAARERAVAAASSGPEDNSFATSVPRRRPEHQLPAILQDRRVQWSLCLGLVVLGCLLCLVAYQDMFSVTALAIHLPLPAPPTAAELAKLAPQLRLAPLADEVTIWHAMPVPRINVAEAPTEHMVYPVSPNVSLSGKVDLNVVIATDGRVKQVRALSGKPPLVEAAEQAARQWRYNPYAVKGQPAEGEANVVVAFRGADAVSLEFPSAGQASKN